MVNEFILSALLLIVLLYLPGFFMLKSVNCPNIRAICFSPVFSIFLYCVAGIIFDELNIATTGSMLSLSIVVLSMLVFGISYFARSCRKKVVHSGEQEETYHETPVRYLWACLFGYCVIGVVLFCLVYLNALPSLDAVPEDYDNIFHFNLVRSFINSESWSLLNVSIYLDTAGIYPAPFAVKGVYYPAAWHVLCAFPVSILGVDMGIAANALNLVLVAIVFALAMFAFLGELFNYHLVKLVFGAAIVFAFSAFPWVMVAFWALYPNLLSMILVPLVVALFLRATKRNAPLAMRIRYFGLTIIGVFSQAFCQPNSVFVDVVILASYVTYSTTKALLRQAKRNPVSLVGQHEETASAPSASVSSGLWRIRILGCIVVLAILTIWFVFSKAPFMQHVVDFFTPPIMSTGQALASSISLSLAISSPQYALGILVLIGAIYILVRERNMIWLLVSYIIALVLFIVSASLGDVWVKHFLTGFWYSDPYRVAAIVPLVGIPLAVLGLDAIFKFLLGLATRVFPSASWSKVVSFSVVFCVAAITIYVPGAVGNANSNAFKFLRFASADVVTAENRVAYSEEEQVFVKKAMQIIGEDEVVLNNPFDGSMVAYGLSGLPVYNRWRSNYNTTSESSESAILRKRLNQLSTDEEVQDIIEDLGAGYVLSLGKSEKRMKILFYDYDPDTWSGFNQISEDTPGVELVLSDGTRKLYKIVSEKERNDDGV